MYLLKDKKAALKFSFLILGLIAIVAIIVYAGGVVADTHTSSVTITPSIVPNASSVEFNADVEWTSGDSIHEFRVYQPLEFSDLDCDVDSDDEWYAPFYAHTTINGTEYYYCQWSAKPGHVLDAANSQKDFTFSLNTAETECCRKLFVETRDDDGAYVFHEPDVCVDTSAPTTTKTFDGPQKLLNCPGPDCVEWIDGITKINLTAIDPEPHPSGIDKTYYKNILAADILEEFDLNWDCADDPCKDRDLCESLAEYADDENLPSQYQDWNVYHDPFTKHEESCHILYYYSEDKVGNEEEIKTNCFFVDKTPPVGTKEVGEPNVYWDEITDAADRIIDLQHTDGSWDWVVTSQSGPTGTTYYNIAGVTAEVLLDAYRLTGDTKYLDAAKDTGDYIITQSGTPIDKTKRHNVFNMLFLYHLEEASGDSQYDNHAAAMLDHIINEENYFTNNLGNHCTTSGCTASQLLEALKAYRASFGDPNGIVPWDLFHFIEVAQIAGESSFANNMASELGNYMGQSGFDNTIEYYDLGLSGGIMGLGKAGVDYSSYLNDLLAEQEGDGSFDNLGSEPIQTTAYALMALEYAGETDAASAAAFYLVNNFGYSSYDGWLESDDEEYSEVTSEAAQALYDIASIEGIWVMDHETEITLDCEDQGPHPSGDEEVCFRVSYDIEPWLTKEYCKGTMQGPDDDDWCCVDVSDNLDYTIIFQEDSLHDLEYFCRDAVNKTSEIDKEWFRVDSVPPEITKIMIGTDHMGDCPPTEEGDECYVRNYGQNGVAISVVDPDPTGMECNVGVDYCTYGLWWEYGKEECKGETEGGWCLVDGGEFSDYQEIFFTEDSTHELHIYCVDALGNYVEDTEIFLVDSTPPVTTKTYEGPHYPDPIVEGQYPHWITSDTLINLTAKDAKVGVNKTYSRITLLNDNKYCESYASGECINAVGSGDFVEYQSSFLIQNESCHLIEYYSVDKLNNSEEIKRQCVYVDNTPPLSIKEVGDPRVEGNQNPADWYVTKNTPILLSCVDQGDHPVNHEILHWRFSTYTDGFQGTPTYSDWDHADTGFPIVINFPNDCWHDLEYYCTDGLGNAEAPNVQYYIVDTLPPKINKTIIGPRSGDCPPEPGSNDICYIDGITNITVDVVDPDPHPVNQVTCDWSYTVDDGDSIIGGQGLGSPFIVHFPEESEHDLTITCRDALGNTAIDVETFFVDQTGPEITKTYEGPQYPNLILPETEYPHYINSETNITISVDDSLGEHDSGVNKTKYRYGIVEDEYCNGTWVCEDVSIDTGWTTLDDPTQGIFQIPDDSCHLIEIYAEDNVEKSSTHKQCVFVDNTPPTPVKEVGVPKTKWDGQDSDFYPWIADKCWNGEGDQIECWKVTLDTLINMTCEDPTPHPVDHERICFNVERNGEDWTESYCKEYNGNYNESEDGYCCLERTIENFTFLGSCEHNLKFYCEDALGNKGPIDEEKFKVEGNDFEIQINKKWNLISVPVVLLSDNISEVFEDIANDIESVWAYDAKLGEWYVYTPDGNDLNDNLHELIPGWGYWVLATDDTTLVIGGSLLAPGITPPSRNLVEGWNLVGYYGIKDKNGTNVQEYDGPNLNGDGQEKVCALGTLCGPLWFEEWGSVVTYWQPTSNPWVYLDGRYDYMNPGAGYWVFMRDNGEYSKATGCCSFLGS